MLKKYLNFTFIIYLLTASVLVFLVDAHKVETRRLNTLLGYSDYIVTINEPGVAVDKVRLYTVLTYYKTLADLQPRLSQADEMVAYSYYFLGDYKSSERWLEKSFKMHPERVWVKYNLGILAYKQGNAKKAVQYFQEILNGDFKDQLSGAVLSGLSTFPPENRKSYFMLLPVFINEVRQKSLFAAVQNDGYLMLHPWWHFFYPGQEVLH